jgi:ferritin
MIHKEIEAALNKQIGAEANSSQLYLAMASWAETQGYEGISNFFYSQSNEERQHMLKLVKYVNERGGQAHIPAIEEPLKMFDCLTHVFQDFLNHEVEVSRLINELVHTCLENRDYTTHNFLQWYVSEQIEEEALARTILDKLKLIGSDKAGLYLFDRDISQITVTSAADPGVGV